MAAAASDRHESADALAGELSALKGLGAVPTGQPSKIFVRRWRLVALAALVAVLGLLSTALESVRKSVVATPAGGSTGLAERWVAQARSAEARPERPALQSSLLSGATGELLRSESDPAPESSRGMQGLGSQSSWKTEADFSEAQASQPQRKRATSKAALAAPVTPRAGKIYLKDL
jgi:hypothetical protein